LRFEIDGTVAFFALILAALTTAAFGLVPALRASAAAVATRFASPRAGVGGPADRFRPVLIVSEVAIAVVLVTGGVLMMRGLATVLAVDPGLRAANVWSARLSLPPARYRTAEQQKVFYGRVLEQVRTLPRVQKASAISSLPMSGSSTVRSVAIEGRPTRAANEELLATVCTALPDYFETLGIPLVRGRTFDNRDDRPDAPAVAVVNEAFVRRFLPPGDALGTRVSLGSGTADEPWMTIVGIVADVRHESLEVPAEPALFTPYGHRPNPSMTIVVKADAAPLSLTEPIRRIVARLDPDRPPFGVRTMEQVMARSIWQSRFFTWLLAVFGGLALLLASVGVYSVISYTVAQRTGEIGLRLALGATRGDIYWLVMRQGLMPTLVGLAAGLAAAPLVGRALGSWLQGVSPTDPVTYAMVSLALLLAAAAAWFIPSRRAAGLDPLTTLRGQ
jgi:putative ABC transport system permease protein